MQLFANMKSNSQAHDVIFTRRLNDEEDYLQQLILRTAMCSRSSLLTAVPKTLCANKESQRELLSIVLNAYAK